MPKTRAERKKLVVSEKKLEIISIISMKKLFQLHLVLSLDEDEVVDYSQIPVNTFHETLFNARNLIFYSRLTHKFTQISFNLDEQIYFNWSIDATAIKHGKKCVIWFKFINVSFIRDSVLVWLFVAVIYFDVTFWHFFCDCKRSEIRY